MTNYHEPLENLDEHTRNITRAINSLKEEIEHACMTLEWLRRNMDKWDEELRTYLFTDVSILEVEANMESGEGDGGSPGKQLDIGDMKK